MNRRVWFCPSAIQIEPHERRARVPNRYAICVDERHKLDDVTVEYGVEVFGPGHQLMHDVLHDERPMRFCRVQPRCDVHALLAVERQTVLPFALGERDLVDVETGKRLTHDLLLVVQIVGMDFQQLYIHWLPDLLDQG